MSAGKGNTNRIRDALSRIYDGQPPYFREYLRRYKEDPKSRVFAPLAEAYRRMGKVDDAIAICLEGLEHHPEFTGGRVALAKCYLEKKRPEDAKAELEGIIDQVPENLLAQKLLGETYQALNDLESALHCYKMALLLAPADVALAQKVKKIESQQKDVAFAQPEEEAEEIALVDAAEADLKQKAENASETKTDLPVLENTNATQEAELIPIVSDDGKIELVPFTDEKSVSSVDRLLGIDTDAQEEDAYRVEHVSELFELEQSQAEITTETLGDLYYGQGQFEQALRIFEAIQLNHSTPELQKKIEASRSRLAAGDVTVDREKKIELLQGILGRLKDSKTHQP